MHDHRLIAGTIITCLFFGACAFQEDRAFTISRPSADGREIVRIDLDRPLHFITTDGTDMVAPAGSYLVEETEDAQLRLLSEEHAPILLAADHMTHDIALPAPFALTFAAQEDQPHLLLLMPDGRALDAIASVSGIRTRDTQRVSRHYRFSPESGTLKFGNGIAGATPPAGSSIVTPSYRIGAGAAGATGSESELSMINLQSVISQRQTALQLTQAILAAQHERFHLEYNSNRPGGDYAQRVLQSAEACRTACAAEGICQAFTFVKPATAGGNGQCFLKQAVPTPVAAACCISGKRKSAQEEILGNVR